MSRDIPFLLEQHFAGSEATTAICWAIQRKDGLFIRGTEHDRDIEIPTGSPSDDLEGTYHAQINITSSDIQASSDMSVDNMEVSGAFNKDITLSDLTVQLIESGLLNNASVTIILVNWKDPTMGYVVLRRGYLGQITHDSDFKYTTEIRGLSQLLSQVIIQTFSERCNVVRLGDARCKKDLTALRMTGTITSVVSRLQFQVSGFTGQIEDYFTNGIITGVAGANAGLMREVKFDSYLNTHGMIRLWEGWPYDVQIGDTFSMDPGCDRLLSTCINKFDNALNHRGFGAFIPGALAILAGPTSTTADPPSPAQRVPGTIF